MKTMISIIISFAMLLLFNGCSNTIDPILEPKTEFSFTFNGQDYLFPEDKFTNVAVKSYAGYFSFTLNMINVFGGEIHFDNEGCAYLVPDHYTVYQNGGCVLTSQENGHIVPVDATKVFTFQSGYLNVTFSDYQQITERMGLAEYTYTTCLVSGTFELTLANSNNETIEITNGNIANFYVALK